MTYWFCAMPFLDVLHYGNTSWNFPKHSIQHQWLCKFYSLLTRFAPVPREICHTQSLILWKSFRRVLSSNQSFQILSMRRLKMGGKYKHNWKLYFFLFFYPFHSRSEQAWTSPHNFHTPSRRQVMISKKMINKRDDSHLIDHQIIGTKMISDELQRF